MGWPGILRIRQGGGHVVQMVRWKGKVPDPGRLQDSLGTWIMGKWENRTALSRRNVFKFIFSKDYSGSFKWIKARFWG